MTKSSSGTVPAQQPQTLSIPDAFSLALRLQQEGKLAQSEAWLRQILQAVPGHAPALHLLGIIAQQSGNTEQGVRLLKEAVAIEPGNGHFHSNLGEMCRLLGRLEEAIMHGEQAVALAPGMASAHSNLGIAWYDSGDLDKAEACQRRALTLAPDLPPALNNLGSILRDRKDLDGAIACYRKVLAVAPGYLESASNLGSVLTENEQPEAALQVLLPLVQARPDYPEAHCNIANAFLALEQLDKAAFGFNRALTLKPDYPEACIGLSRVLQEQGKLQDALATAQRAVALAPQKAEGHSLLGNLYTESGHPEDAEAAFKKALELDPQVSSAQLGYGHLLMEQGKMAAAEERFRAVLTQDEDDLGARLALAQLKKAGADDPNMQALIAKADNIAGLPEIKAMPLHFALGKCYDDTGQPDLAFPHFLAGCQLKRKRIQYDADDNDLIGRNIREFFSPENIERLRGEGCPSQLPIFVLGMPRSGTTLTETILASHPMVHGAGELPDLMEIACTPHGPETVGYPLSLRGITRTELKIMGERYVAGLQARAPEALRITDKMPANFNALGLIHLMLPNAKIVHVKRNPVDICLSGFMHLFNRSQYQSYDLTEMGRYYRSYALLMQHWRKVLPPEAFYEIQYEDLVADQEAQARALLAYCGLPWDEACLSFHKTERSVRTASVTQVRQPMYKSSIERWRRYEKHLGPLLEALGEFAPG